MVVAMAEMAATAVTFQSLFDLDCKTTAGPGSCMFVGSLLIRGTAVFAVLLIYSVIRFGAPRAAPTPARFWPFVQVAGFVLVFGSALLAASGNFATQFHLMLPALLVGAMLAALGMLFWLAPLALWKKAAYRDGLALALAVTIAFATPELLTLMPPLWTWPPLTSVTFGAVAFGLRLLPGTVWTDPSLLRIGFDDFVVEVGEPCSGIEGMALIAALLLFYLVANRQALRFPHALMLLPIGLLASYVLNTVRIVALLWIGARISPDLAVTGFHSYAGWLIFTLLALGLVSLSRVVPLFRRAESTRRPNTVNLRQDRNAAFILSFMALMLSALVVATFAQIAELWYPLRVVTTAVVVACFYPVLWRLDWRPDLVSLASGACIGLIWTVTAPSTSPGPLGQALEAFSPGLLFVWVIMRLIGSVLLVPLVEEGFFRGYLLARFDGGPTWRIAGLLLSSALFALLHDRWLAAFASGLIFGLLMLRRDRLADPVAAHVCANAVLAAWAVLQSDWQI